MKETKNIFQFKKYFSSSVSIPILISIWGSVDSGKRPFLLMPARLFYLAIWNANFE